MATKTIYKKITLDQAYTRVMKPLTPTQKTKVTTIVGNFIQYLKAAHS